MKVCALMLMFALSGSPVMAHDAVTIHGKIKLQSKFKHGVSALIHQLHVRARWVCIKTRPFVTYAGSVAQIVQEFHKK